MTLDEMERLARSRVDSKERDLRDITECRRMEAIDTLTGAARGMTEDAANLARALLLVMPVVRAAMQLRDDEELHTGDSNCAAGDHDDCPSRISDPALFEAIDTMRAAMEEGT